MKNQIPSASKLLEIPVFHIWIPNEYGPRYYSESRSIARFIWNAEISVSIAIHCYECLF